MILSEAIQSLMDLQAKLAAYGHAMGLLFYDGATTAPKGTAANRGQTMSILSEEDYKLTTGGETVALLEFLDEHKAELDEKQQRMVFLLIKDIRDMQKIPMDEYVAYQQLLVEADDVWHRAKETSDFALFEPVLEKIFETNIRFAHYCAPEKDPYDYWLSEYEDGLTMAQCDEFFATLREHIVPLLKKIKAQPQLDDAMLHGYFPEEKQAQLSDYLMRTMGLDLDHVGLSTTEHPFTTSLGSHFDERITTHYLEENFASSMFSVIHEGGHALYDTGSADDLAYTVLDGGVSMGIHESQSRFYENLLGRSRAFTGFVFPKLCELFPELSGHTAEEFYRAINKAEPSLYKEYLGVDVPDDKHGVLQDSHWSGGSIGYFPSYALGSAYGAQLLRKMRETVDVDECLKTGNFAPINAWNREHIWQYGCLKKPGALLEQALGEKFDPTVYTQYLEEKYGEIYGL